MSKYYTNVCVHGNHILFRGVNNGRRVKSKVNRERDVRHGKKWREAYFNFSPKLAAPRCLQNRKCDQASQVATENGRVESQPDGCPNTLPIKNSVKAI